MVLQTSVSPEAIGQLRQSGQFDAAWYANRYADVAMSGIDPAQHYLWIGRRLGRRSGPDSGLADTAASTPAQARAKGKPGWNDLPVHPDRPNRWVHNTAAIARNRAQALAPLTRSFNPASMNIHWIIPDFGPGGGGHMSIFRMVRYLESFGHRQTIWIQNPTVHQDEKQAWEHIRAWYQPIDRVIVRFLPEEVEGISGDLVIATDMWTTFPAAQMSLMKERFYLVQDYEALFHTHGTFTYVADMTYRMGFKAVCAGAWLKSICEERYGLWTRAWELAYDPMYYYRGEKIEHDPPRIAFYARAATPRRAVELGREALLILHDRGVRFRVDLFGQDDFGAALPYEHVNHGLLSPAQLGDLYRSTDIGMVFSASNYSLIPMEMMACGLPVVELDAESTRAVFPEGAVAFAPPTPHDMADVLQRLIESAAERERLRAGGAAFVAGLSWEKSARTLEAALIEGLSENSRPVTPRALFTTRDYAHKAAVIIPTWNGGDLFRSVLQALVTQQTDWAFDVMVVDSGSTDNTLEIIREFSHRGVRLHQIPNSEFSHGRTRNLAISMTTAEFVAVLTQDATPATPHWLANMIAAFDKGDQVAGVFGGHLTYPDATSFVRNGQEGHFAHFAAMPHVAQWGVTPPGMEWGGTQWQQWLHYFSDNNAALRRCVWDKIPYPDIPWGEDQVWAWEVTKQGYQKAYAPDAFVTHSHNLSEAAQDKVSRIEGDYWLRYFNYRFEKDPQAVKASVDYLDTRDAAVAGVAPDVLAHQQALNRAAVCGRYRGQFDLVEQWRAKWS
ncbi:glycosyltransferase [Novosphingobium sediminicola]|uniref:Glycosyltransferase involved in cell wall biosynthesis n=1 Tax=Novosphingobium sediminicola TaxID=563162 RepID=A0A7W6CGL3_9SPHN|nr:glycosyltransferase [Novosphingobium sediminicola]MBB3955095.1 glycosyltransferase involved in cell wall biosynthesis [Novosphingobium sediminicola]